MADFSAPCAFSMIKSLLMAELMRLTPGRSAAGERDASAAMRIDRLVRPGGLACVSVRVHLAGKGSPEKEPGQSEGRTKRPGRRANPDLRPEAHFGCGRSGDVPRTEVPASGRLDDRKWGIMSAR